MAAVTVSYEPLKGHVGEIFYVVRTTCYLVRTT